MLAIHGVVGQTRGLWSKEVEKGVLAGASTDKDGEGGEAKSCHKSRFVYRKRKGHQRNHKDEKENRKENESGMEKESEPPSGRKQGRHVK